MLTERRPENRTHRLARLLEAWRYDRTKLTAEDIGWLLERALETQDTGLGMCIHCARDLDDPLITQCWYCLRDAELLEGGKELRLLD